MVIHNLVDLPPFPRETPSARDAPPSRSGGPPLPEPVATRQPNRFFHAVFDALASHVAVLGGDGKILEVNRAWLAFASANGGPPESTAVGANYFEICRRATGSASAQAASAIRALRHVLTGQEALVEFDYPCHAPTQQRWFRFQATPLREGRARVLVAHQDVSIGQGLLSPREQQVLTHIARGLTSSEIARTLHLARATVETHVRNAIQKLDASTRSNAVLVALQRGEIAPPSLIDHSHL